MEFIGEKNPVFTGKSAQYIQHDANGRAYTIDPWGKKGYITSVDRQRQEGGSGLLSNREFNPDTGEYDTKINWGNIIGLGTAGVIGGSAIAGALPAAAGPSVAGTTGSGTIAAGAPAGSAATGAVGGAAATGGGVNWTQLLLGAGGQGLDALSKKGMSDAQLAEQRRQLALLESEQDPYRGPMFQARDLARLDMMANADSSPVRVTSTSRYAEGAPVVSGGTNWTPSAGLRASAAAAQRSVASGKGAPSVLSGSAPPPPDQGLDLSAQFAPPPAAAPSSSRVPPPPADSGVPASWLDKSGVPPDPAAAAAPRSQVPGAPATWLEESSAAAMRKRLQQLAALQPTPWVTA